MESMKEKYIKSINVITILLKKRVSQFGSTTTHPSITRAQEIVSLATDLEKAIYVMRESERIIAAMKGKK